MYKECNIVASMPVVSQKLIHSRQAPGLSVMNHQRTQIGANCTKINLDAAVHKLIASHY